MESNNTVKNAVLKPNIFLISYSICFCDRALLFWSSVLFMDCAISVYICDVIVANFQYNQIKTSWGSKFVENPVDKPCWSLGYAHEN